MSEFSGTLTAIRISDDAGQGMNELQSVEAIEGKGLDGDRYANLKGAFQKGEIDPQQHVTLIEEEAIAAANADYDVQVEHATTRRNLLTSGVPLNHLVGVEFRVGGVVLKGLQLCEPCAYLNKHSGQDLISALRHRGGLRAEVVQGGRLQVGDPILPSES